MQYKECHGKIHLNGTSRSTFDGARCIGINVRADIRVNASVNVAVNVGINVGVGSYVRPHVHVRLQTKCGSVGCNLKVHTQFFYGE